MKTNQMLIVTLVLSMTALPAFAVSETVQTGISELTLADFQRSGGKPVQAWEQYRQYKYRLAHPAPKPTLEASRMRMAPAEWTLADFQRSAGKPVQAWEQYRQYQYRQAHPSAVSRDNYIGGTFSSSGKPLVDSRKAR